MSLPWWTRVLAPGGQLSRGAPADADEVYLAFPGPRAPSILADVDSAAAVRGALVRSGVGVARREQILRALAARATASARVRRRLPTLVHVTAGEAGTLRDQLRARLGADVRLWLTAGPVRPNRKPVIRVLDGTDRVVAFAKIGWDAATAALIATEADALGSLRERPCHGLIVPDVVDHFDWTGLSILVTRPLPVDADPVVAADAEVPALRRLVEYGGRSSQPLATSAYYADLVERLGPRRVLAETEAAASGDDPVALGGHHGDWSPWNIRRTLSDLGLYVWDWERSRVDGPVGLDLAHYVMQVGRFIEGQTVAAAARRAQDALGVHLPAFDVDPGEATRLVRLALLETVARLVESGLADQLIDRRNEVVEVLGTLRPIGAPP